MKYFFVSIILFISLQALPQDCSKELLAKKPGIWKAGMKGSIVNVSAADLIKEKAAMADIHKMVSSNYNPIGCQVTFNPSFGKHVLAGESWIADPYSYSMYILKYLCHQQNTDKSKYYVAIATPTTVVISANVIYSLDNLYAKDLDDDFRGYLKLEKRPVKKDGYYYMGEKTDYSKEIYEYRWLITYNDTLPFSYLSRKEYLLIQKKRLEKSVRENPGEKAFLEKYFNNINDYLKQPETELSKPAISMWNEEQRFKQFVEEGTNGSFISVKPNLVYYKKNLPKSSPQFFSVVYTIAKDDPVFEKNIEAIKKAVDFAKLKNMLGK